MDPKHVSDAAPASKEFLTADDHMKLAKLRLYEASGSVARAQYELESAGRRNGLIAERNDTVVVLLNNIATMLRNIETRLK